jgi:hypothetical protein
VCGNVLGHKDSVTHIASLETFLTNIARLVICMQFDVHGVFAFDILLFDLL